MVLYFTFTSCWICSRAHHARCVGLDRSDARFICSACQRRTQERTIAGGRKEVGGSKYFYHSIIIYHFCAGAAARGHARQHLLPHPRHGQLQPQRAARDPDQLCQSVLDRHYNTTTVHLNYHVHWKIENCA